MCADWANFLSPLAADLGDFNQADDEVGDLETGILELGVIPGPVMP